MQAEQTLRRRRFWREIVCERFSSLRAEQLVQTREIEFERAMIIHGPGAPNNQTSFAREKENESMFAVVLDLPDAAQCSGKLRILEEGGFTGDDTDMAG